MKISKKRLREIIIEEIQKEAGSIDIGKNTEFYQGFSSKEAKKVIDDAIRNYEKDLRKVQY